MDTGKGVIGPDREFPPGIAVCQYRLLNPLLHTQETKQEARRIWLGSDTI